LGKGTTWEKKVEKRREVPAGPRASKGGVTGDRGLFQRSLRAAKVNEKKKTKGEVKFNVGKECHHVLGNERKAARRWGET